MKTPPTGVEAPKAPESDLSLSKPADPPASPPAPEVPEVKEPEPAKVDPPKAVVSEEDVAALREEFAAKGELSDESLTKFEAKTGIPKQYVIQFAQGAAALQTNVVNEAYAMVGGKETFEVIKAWAVANLPKADQDAFQKAVTTGTKDQVLQAVNTLKTKYIEANGSPPVLAGGRKGASGPEPFRSIQEAAKAMQHPDYHRDPGYRAQVEARLAVTKI